jgi:hypothetical protein
MTDAKQEDDVCELCDGCGEVSLINGNQEPCPSCVSRDLHEKINELQAEIERLRTPSVSPSAEARELVGRLQHWLGQEPPGSFRAPDLFKAAAFIERHAVWRTMDSAPRDGTPILTWGPEFFAPTMNYWHNGGWYDYGDPTHWQPLPSPPSKPEGEQQP